MIIEVKPSFENTKAKLTPCSIIILFLFFIDVDFSVYLLYTRKALYII